MIALILMVILIYYVVSGREKDINTNFWNIFLIVIGFYFGTNTTRKDRS